MNSNYSRLLLLALLMLSACAAFAPQRTAPPNLYVDGPMLIAQARQLNADLLNEGVISSERGMQIRTMNDAAQDALDMARHEQAKGDTQGEVAALSALASALETVRTFTRERK